MNPFSSPPEGPRGQRIVLSQLSLNSPTQIIRNQLGDETAASRQGLGQGQPDQNINQLIPSSNVIRLPNAENEKSPIPADLSRTPKKTPSSKAKSKSNRRTAEVENKRRERFFWMGTNELRKAAIAIAVKNKMTTIQIILDSPRDRLVSYLESFFVEKYLARFHCQALKASLLLLQYPLPLFMLPLKLINKGSYQLPQSEEIIRLRQMNQFQYTIRFQMQLEDKKNRERIVSASVKGLEEIKNAIESEYQRQTVNDFDLPSEERLTQVGNKLMNTIAVVLDELIKGKQLSRQNKPLILRILNGEPVSAVRLNEDQQFISLLVNRLRILSVERKGSKLQLKLNDFSS